jgi:Leucine-rich repeat (LRR) protein
MWHLLSDDIVLYILCFATNAALPTVTRLNTFCNDVARERLSSLKRLTEKPFYVRTSNVFKNVLSIDKQLNDAGLIVLAPVLWALPQLEELYLYNNQIGDVGISALAKAITPSKDRKRALASCQKLDLSYNQISDAGLTALAGALSSGALPQLKELWLGRNSIGDVGLSALADVVSSGALAQVSILRLHENQIGDAGLTALASACASGALDHLTVCWHPTALFPCLETWHAHSPDSYLLFEVPYAAA